MSPINIVFDLDGTLIDSAPDIQSAASEVLRGCGKEGLSLAETRSFIGEGAALFVRRMMEARDIAQTPQKLEALNAEFLEQYAVSVDKAVFYPGVQTVLAKLKSKGHKLGLCTNKPEHPARAAIRHMGIDSAFEAFIAGGMGEPSKPKPDMLLRVIEQLGDGLTLYVGDSETDALTAKRARVPFALFSQGYRRGAISDIHHDWVFEDFEALPAIVEQASALQKR